MNTIYMLTPGSYFEDVLDGFSYDYDGLRIIAERHIRGHLGPDASLTVTVGDGEISVIEEDGWTHHFTIHKIERVR